MGVTIRKKDGQWYVFVNHEGHRKAKCIGSNRRAAEQVKLALESKLALGELGLAATASDDAPTFAAYAQQWLEQHVQLECKPSTFRSYEQLLRIHVTPRFGQKKLTGISRDSVKQFVSELSKTKAEDQHGTSSPRYSRNTLRLIVCALRAVLQAAVEDDLISSNPAARVGRFAKSGKPAKQAGAMSRLEAERFLSAVKETCPEWLPFFLTALRAGLRKGELIALKWGDIHFGASATDPNRYILVQRNWVCDEFTSPKSKKKRRVDLSKQVRQVLVDLHEKRTAIALEAGRTSIADDLVFPSRAGTPLKPDNIAVRYMQPALEKAGLRKFRFHDLRHTFGSLLIQDGASLAYVKEQMGHSSIQITVDTYGHLVPGADISWIDRLDSGSTVQLHATPAQLEPIGDRENRTEVIASKWLPPRDSNPDMLIQSQLSYH